MRRPEFPSNTLTAEARGGLVDVLLFFLAVAVAVAVGFFLGRDYERINALAAEEAAPVVTINKAQAAARIQPRCPKARRDDVRLAVAGR